MHYMHQQRFFQHSARGGGWVYQDPILNVFNHMYRQIRERVRYTNEDNIKQFEEFVKECIEGQQDNVIVSTTISATATLASESGPLHNKRFVLVGSFASLKLNHDKLKDFIFSKGGKVFNISSVPENLPVDMIVISQPKRNVTKEVVVLE